MKPDSRYRAGLYMRLSKEDEGVAESASISAQRKLLRAYAKENNFDIFDEYADDGYAGTGFARPAWNRLLEDIEAEKVNMVITKDLSRLGRNYIVTGQLTEVYFPEKGVRCIAVNDGYDSESPGSDIVPFKNIVNEMYARDASRKIRSSLQTKIKEGAFIGNFAPYGYQKDPKDKNHLVVDPAAAAIVHEIFSKAEQGELPSEIAGDLNCRGILTPAMYRCARFPHLKEDDYSRRKEWTSGTICKLLANQVYLGCIVQGKTAKASFKSGIILQKPRKDWVAVENMHEPIVSREVFERVRRRSVSRRHPPVTGFSNLFSGIAVCKDCGRKMSVTGTGSHRKLVCGGYKLYGTRECTNHFFSYDLLCEIMTHEIGSLLLFTEEEKEKILREFLKKSQIRKSDLGERASVPLRKREGEIEKIIRQLYEDRINGKLTEERFGKLLAAYEKEQKEIEGEIRLLCRGKASAGKGEDEDCGERLFDLLMKEIHEEHILSSDLLALCVDKIEIGQGNVENEGKSHRKVQTICIYYRVTDTS